MRPIIKVENLSKQYRIGVRQEAHTTLREALGNTLRSPLNLLRRDSQRGDNTIWALKDVSFEIMPGEVVGVIGRNGAGKSTLLKILSRITEPTTGQVDIYGRVKGLLEVGTGFHPELTGRENIYLNGAILGMKRDEIELRFDDIVAFAEVEKFLDTPVKRYSSGMYMRLAFAVAAHLEPEILLVDEVLAVGDAAFQKKCLGKMGEVARRGRTVVFVSHNIGAIKRLCSECILLENGSVRVAGKASVIVKEYLSLFERNYHPTTIVADGADCDVYLHVLDKNGNPTRKWQYGEELTVQVDIMAGTELRNPAIDIACYTSDRTRLFALQSDKMGEGPKSINGQWSVKFHIQDPGFTVPEMCFDVGLRMAGSRYLVLINEASWLFPDHTPVSGVALTDCILYPKVTHAWKANDEVPS
jgi:lipopolysaccharide transport system ATP-binding protein